MVSVIMPVYNHERYLEKAIESVLMQKVNFDFEVLIGEDCSTDESRNLLMHIEKGLPSYFHIFYRGNNLGMGEGGNAMELYSKAVGKYIIALEADDYWLYEGKLQAQVDFLEENPHFIAVAHNTRVVDMNGKLREDYVYPECKDTEYCFSHYKKEVLAGQLTTILRRNPKWIPEYNYIPIPAKYPIDQLLNFTLLCNGRVACIQKCWSAYRFVPESGTSYSAMHKENANFSIRRLAYYKMLVDYTNNKTGNIQAQSCAESMYLYYLLKDVFEMADPSSKINVWFISWCSMKKKGDALYYVLKRIIQAILKKRYR